LVLELLLSGKKEEALERLRTARGVWEQHGLEADLHLLDSRTLESYFASAGLTDIHCKGLLVTASALGLIRCNEALNRDEAGLLELERQLFEYEILADTGKHMIACGRRSNN
jgi:hypothetical protein